MGKPQYRVVATVRMNFYPGTLEATPPDYRREIESELFETRDDAEYEMAWWGNVVQSPGWKFRIDEVPAAAGKGEGDEVERE
jgi:hypothetical protein